MQHLNPFVYLPQIFGVLLLAQAGGEEPALLSGYDGAPLPSHQAHHVRIAHLESTLGDLPGNRPASVTSCADADRHNVKTALLADRSGIKTIGQGSTARMQHLNPFVYLPQIFGVLLLAQTGGEEPALLSGYDGAPLPSHQAHHVRIAHLEYTLGDLPGNRPASVTSCADADRHNVKTALLADKSGVSRRQPGNATRRKKRLAGFVGTAQMEYVTCQAMCCWKALGRCCVSSQDVAMMVDTRRQNSRPRSKHRSERQMQGTPKRAAWARWVVEGCAHYCWMRHESRGLQSPCPKLCHLEDEGDGVFVGIERA
ncbi:hypothetical protein MRX96_004666 [Rhipicephalus microplus]